MKKQFEIYYPPESKAKIEVRVQDETLWLNQYQIAELFDTDRTSILRHIKNIYKTNELAEKSTCAKFAHVQTEGKRKVTREILHYNLDMIISVGYRVNSKKGTQFRIWANDVLKRYLLDGFALNEAVIRDKNRKLEELRKVVHILSQTNRNHLLSTGEKDSINRILEKYSFALSILDNYDNNKYFDIDDRTTSVYRLNYQEVIDIISQMKRNRHKYFGKEKDSSLKSSISAIYQTFDGLELYPGIIQKAAHLLYFLIKNHSFVDGNKRIASAIFLYFLEKNNLLDELSDNNLLNNNTLASISLLIANSKPNEKDLIINIITTMLQIKH